MNASPLLVAVLLLASALRADETARADTLSGTEVAGAEDAIATDRSPTPDPSFRPPKSHLVAHGLSLAATIVPLGAALAMPASEASFFLGASGVLLGPSAGHLYVEPTRPDAVGVLVRVMGGMLTLMGGLALSLSGDTDRGNPGDLQSTGEFLLGTGYIVTGIGIWYSILYTHHAVDHVNERAREASIRTSFAPALFPVGDGRLAPGLTFNALF